MSVEDPVEMQKLADALPVERAASRWIVSNDPGRGGREGRRLCRPRLQAPGVPCAGPDQERFLKLFAEQVSPRLRKKFA
jgi:hypothetical protein